MPTYHTKKIRDVDIGKINLIGWPLFCGRFCALIGYVYGSDKSMDGDTKWYEVQYRAYGVEMVRWMLINLIPWELLPCGLGLNRGKE